MKLSRKRYAPDSRQDFVIPPRTLRAWFQKGFVVPLAVEIPCSADAWQLFLAICSSPQAFFLDGAVRGKSETSRYSYFGEDPFLILRSKNGKTYLENGKRARPLSGGLLGALRKVFREYPGRVRPELPFFTGGAVGYFGYGAAWEFERLPRMTKDDIGTDDAHFLFVRNLFVLDGREKVLYLISNLLPKSLRSFEAAFADAASWIDAARRKLDVCAKAPSGRFSIRQFRADIGKMKFKRMVERAKAYIVAGDIYQANLSQRFSFTFSGAAELLYGELRKINPSPFSSFLRLHDLTVVSSSPERLVKKEGARCEARPIAGTRPRGRTRSENERLRRELAANPKERAEHIMLVDLARNDLGRVCKPHTVRVSEMMTLEEYSHVVHLVSNVVGEMEKGKDSFDLIKAMFPGGTITGCPKIRCMEIIESLEPFERSLYTGSVGWLGFDGNLDLNIVIRTILLKRRKGYFHVGAGIVYDSKPEAEYWETMHKSKALLEALIRSAGS